MELSRFDTQVSIIIPIYNSEKYLRRCLDSIANQTHTCLEVLLIDDGSTDTSRNVCEEYLQKDHRFRYVRQPNSGAGMARNNGIEMSTSEYITFLDSDDTMESTFIEQILDQMLATKSDLGICDINYINSVTLEKKVSKIRFPGNAGYVSNDKRVFNIVRTFIWGKIYKKELFSQIRYPNFNFFEDLATTPIVASLAGRVAYVPQPLINYYRSRSDSLSENYRNVSDIYKAINLLYERLQLFALFHDYQDEYKKMCIGQLRFLYRRFGSTTIHQTHVTLSELKDYMLNLFPNLEPLVTRKYYILDDDCLLTKATDKAVIFSNQIVSCINDADYVICYDHSAIEHELKPYITVKRPNNMDEESMEYDIAEHIIMSFNSRMDNV